MKIRLNSKIRKFKIKIIKLNKLKINYKNNIN